MVGWTEGRKERGTEERRKIGGREGGRSGMVRRESESGNFGPPHLVDQIPS